jgi:hypothetical protein
MESKLEQEFLRIWTEVAPDLTLVYSFKDASMKGKRHPYEYDFHVAGTNILIEINGGIWMKRGAHSGGSALQRDYDKLNKAMLANYKLFMLDSSKITEEYIREIANHARQEENI